MKFIKLHHEWLNLDRVDAFWTTDKDYEYYEYNYGVEFRANGYEEYSDWFKTKEERDALVKKLEDYFGGWL